MDDGFELQLLSAFVDEALDLPQQLEIQARVEDDARLRVQVDGLRRLRDLVRMHATRHAVPDALATRVRESAGLGSRAGAPTRPARTSWQRGLDWQPTVLALGVAALAVWGVNLSRARPVHDDGLMQAAVTSHLRATTGTRLVDVMSADKHALAPWLSTRLAFAAPLPGADIVDATLVGVRIDSLEGRSAEALVYRLRDGVVDVFVLPVTDGDADVDGPDAATSIRGFNVSHWSHGGLHYCVVSDLPRKQLGDFAQAIRRAGDAL